MSFGEPNPESSISPESTPRQPAIRIELFRHDEKRAIAADQPDSTVRLTEVGRRHATAMGSAKNPNPDTGIVYGSTRERSIETAYRQLLANNDEISAESSLEDIRDLMAKHIKVGSKEIVDDRLNFNWNKQTPFGAEAYRRYEQSRDGLRFIFDDSDTLAHRLYDRESSTYARNAGNIAELVRKYVDVLPRWRQIVATNPDRVHSGKNELQRFMASHQTVLESFLLKTIEKTQGRQAAENFIESLPDKNGFGPSEGYRIDIEGEVSNPNIRVEYKGNSWTLSLAELTEMIEERDRLNADTNRK